MPLLRAHSLTGSQLREEVVMVATAKNPWLCGCAILLLKMMVYGCSLGLNMIQPSGSGKIQQPIELVHQRLLGIA